MNSLVSPPPVHPMVCFEMAQARFDLRPLFLEPVKSRRMCLGMKLSAFVGDGYLLDLVYSPPSVNLRPEVALPSFEHLNDLRDWLDDLMGIIHRVVQACFDPLLSILTQLLDLNMTFSKPLAESSQ